MYKRNVLLLYVLFTLVISLNAHAVFAGVMTLSWDAPTTNIDGTPLTDLAGYKLYYGTASGNYSQVIDVGNVTTYTVNLSAGTYYFAVTAYATSRNESSYSNEVSKTMQSIQNGNIATYSTIVASSENVPTGQLAIKTVDGVIDGYPGNYTREWTTNGEKVGAWLKLSWAVLYTVDRVVLYDRPNLNDQILNATLIFSDDSTLQVWPLDNGGMGNEYTFAPKVINSLRMRVDGVSNNTVNIGLSEI